ncbi:hypothetical protein ACW14Y_42565 (plasmid) [Kitasatospora sp. cg17-2]
MSPKNHSRWRNATTMPGVIVASIISGVITAVLVDGLHYLIR